MSALNVSDYPEYTINISNKVQPPLGWGSRPALLLVDVGAAYFSPTSPLSLLNSTATASQVPSNISSLIAAARIGKCPVIWARTLFTNAELRDGGLWARKVSAEVLGQFLNNKSGWLEQEGLRPMQDVARDGRNVPDLVVDKKFVSAFFGTNLATQLTMIGVDTVVVCGARTGGEIRQSVLDAQGLGFKGMVCCLLLFMQRSRHEDHYLPSCCAACQFTNSAKTETDCRRCVRGYVQGDTLGEPV